MTVYKVLQSKQLYVFCVMTMAIVCMLSSVAIAKTGAEIDKYADITLQRFYKDVNGGKEIAKQAKALLVMSNVTKAGFVVGGAYG